MGVWASPHIEELSTEQINAETWDHNGSCGPRLWQGSEGKNGELDGIEAES